MAPHPGQHLRRLPDPRHLAAVGADRLDQRHQRVQLPGAQNKIEVRQLPEKFISEPLGHTSHRADHQIGIPRLELLHVADFADRLAFGLFADAAGVEKQDVRLLFGIHHPVARGDQHSGQRLGVALVHLTAVGFDEDLHESKVRLSR